MAAAALDRARATKASTPTPVAANSLLPKLSHPPISSDSRSLSQPEPSSDRLNTSPASASADLPNHHTGPGPGPTRAQIQIQKHSQHSSPCSPGLHHHSPGLTPSSSTTVHDSTPSQDDLRKLQAELERTKNQLSVYKDVIEAQKSTLESVRSNLSCNICLEILDSPYALLCGHIFCHKDLYAWFHRQGSDGDSELEYHSDQSDTERADMISQLAHQADQAAGGIRNRQVHQALADIAQPEDRPAPRRLSAQRRKKNLICPQCRAAVSMRPFQLYAIKEATDRLRASEPHLHGASDASPLRADVEGHRDEKDLSWGQLFANTPDGPPGGRPHVVIDVEDGVRRCGRCAWELDSDGVCEGCGEMYSIGSDPDDEDYSAHGASSSEDMGTNYESDEEDEDEDEEQFRRSAVASRRQMQHLDSSEAESNRSIVSPSEAGSAYFWQFFDAAQNEEQGSSGDEHNPYMDEAGSESEGVQYRGSSSDGLPDLESSDGGCSRRDVNSEDSSASSGLEDGESQGLSSEQEGFGGESEPESSMSDEGEFSDEDRTGFGAGSDVNSDGSSD